MNLLVQKSKFLIHFDYFKELHPSKGPVLDLKKEIQNPSIGNSWFWKQKGRILYISPKVINRILSFNFLFPKSKASLKTENETTAKNLLQNIKEGFPKLPIPSPLLALLLNEYCYENQLDKGATNTPPTYQEFNYDDIPFKPQSKTENGKVMYKLCEDVWIEADLACLLFKKMYTSQDLPCPFEKHLESSAVPISPTGPLHAASTLGAEWDADGWFETELSNPSKQLEQRSASPTKADAWFTSIASTISKRSASPSKVPLSTRSISPTAATLTSS